MRSINPDSVVKPASAYAQGMVHKLGGERLVISGQIGVRPDGTVVEGLEAQADQAWANLLAVMTAAGFERRHLLRAIVYVTLPGQVAVYRKARDRALEGHLAAMTYIEVAGLAAPEFLIEIEAEAVKEG